MDELFTEDIQSAITLAGQEEPVLYTHLGPNETVLDPECRLRFEKKKKPEKIKFLKSPK